MARKGRRRPKGLGTLYQRGPWWYVQWRENGRRCHEKCVDRLTAEKVLSKHLSDATLRKHGVEVEKAPAPPLATLAEEWIERRRCDHAHRSWGDDRCRWRTHCLEPFGKLRPDELDANAIRALVEKMLADGYKPATCQRVVALLSSLFTDLVERGLAKANPGKSLPRATRRLMRSSHDPKTAAYVEDLADVERIFRALPEPANVGYAIGAMAGLRTAEILGLRWANVDLEHRRITVSEQVQDGAVLPPKSGKARVVPINDALLPVLQAAKLASGGAGLVVPPMREKPPWRRGRACNHFSAHTLGLWFKKALGQLNKQGCGIPVMSWIAATRHTYGSHWIIAGGSMAKLKEVLGHSSITTTERHYVHLRGDIYSAADMALVAVDLTTPAGKVLPMVRTDSGAETSPLATEAAATEAL